MLSKKPISILLFSIISFFTIFTLLGSNNFSNQFKIGKSLMSEMNMVSNDEKILVWIELSDKGSNINYLLSHPELYLTQKAIDRRKKVKPLNALVDISDLPLNNNYVSELKNSGIEIKNRSKWFNRVSCFVTKSQIEQLTNKNFVNRVDLVKKLRRDRNENDLTENNLNTGKVNSAEFDNNDYVLNYGNSLEQMELINAPTAHDSGYMGQGVLIASFDAGFDNLSHPSFDSIRARGLRTYDFVNGDTNVANENGQLGEGSHGTATLSLVGGYRPGQLISPAFRSQYILAKTENTESETPLEEDNWIAAAEWADSLGADIITSSLSYIEMDQGSIRSYDWTWMNGDSCVITIGADLAVNKGIIVCNSAGNYGSHPTHNTIGAPADGDSVFCIGSVNFNRERSSFSSVGPTVDGRIKPDLCALGNGNIVAASGSGNTGYSSGSGTSFSCPMTAGVCAIILSANPDLTPMQVLGFLKQTADSSSVPNNRRGWGLINCWEAVKLAKNVVTIANGNQPISIIEGYELNQNIPNPFNPATTISYSLKGNSKVNIKIYNILGSEVASLVNEQQNAGNYEINFNGSNLSSGVYFYSLIADGNFIGTKRMLLLK